MTSHKYTLLNVQNDDSEINLQFQDFEGNSSTASTRDTLSTNQAGYFNSFSDSIDDEDQEQKLLDDDEGDSRSKASFWTFEYYQKFFDVESRQVGDRIIWSMLPKPGVNFLKSYIRPNPDLYGPFWICVTLIFTTAIAGNLSNYLQTHDTHWRYDFHIVTLATTCIFSYAWFIPVLIWGVLLWRGSKSNITLLELICLYGYSLAIFVPVSLLWMIPLRWLQWCLGIVAAVLSGSVLVRTIQPALSHEAKKVAFGLAVLVILLHAALAIGFMLYFFYPPSAAKFEVEPSVKVNNSIPNAGSDKNQTLSKEKIANKKESEGKTAASVDKKQERSENIAAEKNDANNPARMKQVEDRNAGHRQNRMDSEAGKGKETLPIQKNSTEGIPKAMSLVKGTEKVPPVKLQNVGTKPSISNKTIIDENNKSEKPSSNNTSKSISQTVTDNIRQKRTYVISTNS